MTEYTIGYPADYNPSFAFHDNTNSEVGRFSFKDGVMTFTGNPDETALRFIDFVKKQYSSEYNRLKEDNDRLKRRNNDLKIRLDREERDSEGKTRRWFIGDRVLVGPNGMIATVVKQHLHYDGSESFFGSVHLMYDDGVKGESNSWQLKDADDEA